MLVALSACERKADQSCAGQAHFGNTQVPVGGDGHHLGFLEASGWVGCLVPVELHIWLPQAREFLVCTFEHLCIVEHLSSYSEVNYYIPTFLTSFCKFLPPFFHLLTFCVATVKALLALWWWIYEGLEVVRAHTVWSTLKNLAYLYTLEKVIIDVSWRVLNCVWLQFSFSDVVTLKVFKGWY